jgi:hypothetical protein
MEGRVILSFFLCETKRKVKVLFPASFLRLHRVPHVFVVVSICDRFRKRLLRRLCSSVALRQFVIVLRVSSSVTGIGLISRVKMNEFIFEFFEMYACMPIVLVLRVCLLYDKIIDLGKNK